MCRSLVSRHLSYPETDVLLLLFAVDDNRINFKEIYRPTGGYWVELQRWCPDVPIISVGSKIDKRVCWYIMGLQQLLLQKVKQWLDI